MKRPEECSVGLQEVEGDRRDTETLVLVPCHCEDKEYVRDVGNTEQQENEATEEVEDYIYIVRGSLTDNNKPPSAEGI